MSIVLSATLPKGERNGLATLEDALIRSSGEGQMVVAMVKCTRITRHPDSAKVVLQIGIVDIEAAPAGTPEWDSLRQLADLLREQRTGRTPLPLALPGQPTANPETRR